MSERRPDTLRAPGGWRRRLTRAALGLLAAAALLCAWVYLSTEARLRAHLDVKAARIAVPSDYEAVARGEHVVRAVAKCTGCHGDDLGGGIVMDSPLVGRFTAPNLTTGPLAHRSDEELVLALVHGVAPDGRPLVLMPSHEIGQLGDDDLGAAIAFLRTLPPVTRELPPLRVGPLLRVLMATRRVELLPAERIDHRAARAPAPAAEPTAAYGEYLAKGGGCLGCHGPTLAGGPIPGLPPSAPRAADIRAQALSSWSYEDFDRAMRRGVRPDGRALAELMPWRATARLTDTEMRALYAYLKSARGEGAVHAAKAP